jgi:fatty acid-binding protein DegV
MIESLPIYSLGAVAVTAAATWLGARAWYQRAAPVASDTVDVVVEAGELLTAVRDMLRDGATAEEVQRTVEEAQDVIVAVKRLAP